MEFSDASQCENERNGIVPSHQEDESPDVMRFKAHLLTDIGAEEVQSHNTFSDVGRYTRLRQSSIKDHRLTIIEEEKERDPKVKTRRKSV